MKKTKLDKQYRKEWTRYKDNEISDIKIYKSAVLKMVDNKDEFIEIHIDKVEKYFELILTSNKTSSIFVSERDFISFNVFYDIDGFNKAKFKTRCFIIADNLCSFFCY